MSDSAERTGRQAWNAGDCGSEAKRLAWTALIMFAEYVAMKKEKIALVSIYLETISEMQAQSILKKLIDKVVQAEPEKEGAAT